MKIYIDSHTHSLASGHAYSTVDELARGARKRGLYGFVLTDHGPSIPGGPNPYFFGNLRVIPKQIEGVHVFSGVETNILDMDGSVDLAPFYLGRLDFVLAGFHEACFAPQSREENTRAMIATLANPLVDAISHPGNPRYPVDQAAVVQAALHYGKALELNDSSFRIRKGSDEPCAALAACCVEAGTLLVCGSDAHYWRDVGRFDNVRTLLKTVKASKKQVLNADIDLFLSFIRRRRYEREQASAR